MLAMLLEMTWTWRSWAAIPVAAVCSACMSGAPQTPSGRDLGEFVDRCAALVALRLQQRSDQGVGAVDLDHAAHLDDAVDIGALDRARDHADFVGRLRRHAGGRGE